MNRPSVNKENPLLKEEQTVYFNVCRTRPFITMFTIDKMSGLLLPGLRHIPPRWLASSDVTRDTSKRARVCGQPVRGVVSGFMIATSARHPSDQSRAAADASGRGWTMHVLGKFTSWDRDAHSAIRSAA